MLAPQSCRKQTVFVLGLGRSGRAGARALKQVGARVMGWDDDRSRRAGAAGDGIFIPADERKACAQADVLLSSPGIPLTRNPHPLVSLFRAAGKPIIGDVELFQRVLDEQKAEADCIAITGTNGKTTTASLVAHMLRAAGRDVALGGNIGIPALDLPAPRKGLIYVLELSSFQIELAPSIAPQIAVQLNVTPDHLDRHADMREYAAVKAGLFTRLGASGRRQEKQDVAIVGINDAPGRELLARLRKKRNIRIIALALGDIVLPPVPESVRVSSGLLRDGLADGDAGGEYELDGASSMTGRHNRQNMAAAFAVGRVCGMSPERILNSFADFSPPPHRMEHVAEIDGISFINDSKATNGEAAARSLECFERIHWILGGIPKSDGIAPAKHLFDKIAGAYLIGSSQERFALELRAGGVKFACFDDLRAATLTAAADARKEGGGVVMLAPACASFDQFADFEERGEAFRAVVLELAERSKTQSERFP